MADHYSVHTIRDFDGESSNFKIYNGAITAVSIAGYLTDLSALETAIDGVTIGVRSNSQWVGDNTNISDANAASQWAQRELKMKVNCTGDGDGPRFHFTVPCPDLDNLTLVGDKVTLADGGIMAAFVTAVEQIARHPDDDTETITVLDAEIVGRNI